MIKTIVTVIGMDKVGIIAKTSTLLSEFNVNILDINQTVMQEYFTMGMLGDVAECNTSFDELKAALTRLGEEVGVTVHVQHEAIFQSMHRI